MRRRTPWSVTWESSEMHEVGGGMEVAENLEKRDRFHSFHVWGHKIELAGLL